MKQLMKSLYRIPGNPLYQSLRFISAILGALMLFAILPLASSVFKPKVNRGSSIKKTPVLLMQRIQKEEKEPEKQLHSLRPMNSKVTKNSFAARSTGFSMQFSPDLGVEASGDGIALGSSGSGSDVVFDEGQVDEQPKVLRHPAVPYPQRAQDEGIEGTVKLILLIGISGDVLDITVESTPSPLFINPVVQAVKLWKFIPGKNKGVPVRVRVHQELTFKQEF